jgi:acyl-CoA-binding protein
MPGAEFEAAVKQSRELKAKPSDDELLQVGGSDLISTQASIR